MSELAVVIPVLNEAQAAPALLRALHAQRAIDLEIIVADGGSSDDTAERCRAAGARVIAAPRGRARQMNAGAAASDAPWLLFLHADSGLTHDRQLRDALDSLRAQAEALGHDRIAGHFALRFVRRAPGHERLYRFMQAKTACQRPGSINGDQGLLLSRGFFEALGRFDASLPVFEDQRIAARVFEEGRWLLLPGILETSARRFEDGGPRRVYALMGLLSLMHTGGVDEFFAEARRLYPPPSATRPPRLGAFTCLAAKRIARRSDRLAVVARMLRYSAANAWQMRLLLETLRARTDR